MVDSVFRHNLADRGHHAFLGIAVAVVQPEKLDPFVGIDQTAQRDAVDGHLISGVPMDVRGELHLEAGGGVAANILHYFHVLAKELVDRAVLFHHFDNAVDERNLLAWAFQVPDKLVEGLDGDLLLSAPPGCVLNEITHHLEVMKGPTPVLPRELVGVPMDQSTFLGHKGGIEIVSKAHRVTEGEIEEQDLLGGIEVLAELPFDGYRALVL